MTERDRARSLFWAVGTDESRRIDWAIWRAAAPGSRFLAVTSDRIFEVEVLTGPQSRPDGSEAMTVLANGRESTIELVLSGSRGYYDDHPDERFPGCDRDILLGHAHPRLAELERDPQLELFS